MSVVAFPRERRQIFRWIEVQQISRREWCAVLMSAKHGQLGRGAVLARPQDALADLRARLPGAVLPTFFHRRFADDPVGGAA